MLCSSAAQAEPKRNVPVVVVFSIEDRGSGLSEELRARMSDYLAMAIAATGAYQVVPREQLKSRLVDQKKDSFKSCYDQSCQIEIGRELAAQKLLTTSIVKLASTCTITAVLFDLRKATSEGGATADGDCTNDALVASIKRLVKNLTGTNTQADDQSRPPPPSLSRQPLTDDFRIERRSRKELWVSGLISFSIAYVATIGAVAGVTASTCDDSCKAAGRDTYSYGMMFLPVVGPIVMAAKEDLMKESTRTVGRALLIFGATSQIIGLTLTVAGIVAKKDYRVPLRANFSISPLHGGDGVMFGVALGRVSFL